MNLCLLITLVLCSLAADPLANLSGIEPQAWFYVLRGLEGAVLLMLLHQLRKSTTWKLLCIWGIYESLMTSVCGISYMLRPFCPAAYSGLCDAQTGLPMYTVSLCFAAVLAALVVRDRYV